MDSCRAHPALSLCLELVRASETVAGVSRAYEWSAARNICDTARHGDCGCTLTVSNGQTAHEVWLDSRRLCVNRDSGVALTCAAFAVIVSEFVFREWRLALSGTFSVSKQGQ